MIAADYLALTKPAKIYRLLASFCLAVLIALPILARSWPHVLFAILGGTLAAAGGNALNMYIERDLDATCEQTKSRPLVTGRMQPRAALYFAIGLIAIATLLLFFLVNQLVAGLTLLVVAVYAVLYTRWLKRTTPLYTLVGGAIWASPILIVWMAAGKPFTAVPLLVFALAACWTALHAWSVGLIDAGDACTAGTRFMPLAWGPQATRLSLLVMVMALVTTTALLEQWIMLPFDGLLIAASVAASMVRLARTDALLARTSIVYICAYVCSVLIDRFTPTVSA